MHHTHHKNTTELIGQQITVATSTNQSTVGLTGKVVDETCRSIVIATPRGRKRILKNTVTFTILLQGGRQIIDGHTIVGKHHERLTK